MKNDNYQIRLKGVMNLSAIDWLDGITILPQENGETLLIGKFPDQASLRGLLEQLWNLNFTVLSVEQGKDTLQQS